MRQCGFDGFVEPEVSTVAKVDEVITQKVVVPTVLDQKIIPTVVSAPAVIDVVKEGAKAPAPAALIKQASVSSPLQYMIKNPVKTVIAAGIIWALYDFNSFKRAFGKF